MIKIRSSWSPVKFTNSSSSLSMKMEGGVARVEITSSSISPAKIGSLDHRSKIMETGCTHSTSRSTKTSPDRSSSPSNSFSEASKDSGSSSEDWRTKKDYVGFQSSSTDQYRRRYHHLLSQTYRSVVPMISGAMHGRGGGHVTFGTANATSVSSTAGTGASTQTPAVRIHGARDRLDYWRAMDGSIPLTVLFISTHRIKLGNVFTGRCCSSGEILITSTPFAT